MFWNYLKSAFRNTRKNQLLSFLNIFSLGIGIVASLLIFFFIQEEKSFDRFFSKGEQIFRINEVQSFPGTNTQQVALSMPGMAPHMQEDYPEVLQFTRFLNRGKQLFEKDGQQTILEKVAMVDSTFLKLFDFSMIQGDPATALSAPNTIVLTRRSAEALFGMDNPLGKSLDSGEEAFEVRGILENLPLNSHLQFDALISISTLARQNPDFDNEFGSNYLHSYLLLEPAADMEALEAKMPRFLTKYMPPDGRNDQDVNNFYKIYFQPLSDVHLGSMEVEHDYENYRKFNGAYLDVFALVGIFILLIAGFNFMNLITARASYRWKEVGVRKTMGARKSQLFAQFVLESALLGFFAFLLALLLGFFFTPLVNGLTGRELSMALLLEQPMLLGLALLSTMGISVIAGAYPALYLASYQAAHILRGGDVKTEKPTFRNSLVVLQFGLAIAMIVSTVIVVQQLHYMQTKDIGLDKDHILLADMNQEANQAFTTIKEELLKSRYIKGVTASGQRLGNNFHQWGFKARTDSLISITPSNVNVDYDYLEVYGIQLKEGRSFAKEYSTDADYAFIINESLAEELQLEDPIGLAAGHSWYADDSLGIIIGVAKDFNFNSLHYEINTLAMAVHPDWGYDEMSVKVDGQHVEAAIAEVERIWNELVPDWPFQYSFLDEHFEELYRSDQQMRAVSVIMATLAILIACMGLFGLSAITTERRVKEIGIRKVLGATILQIMYQLARQFTLLVVLAFVLSSPLIYYSTKKWLDNFAYRIDIGPLPFLLGGLAALLIALLTISHHVWRAARSNPVEALRNE